MRHLLLPLILWAVPFSPAQRDTCPGRPGIVYRIARMEGFYVEGSLPDRLHNPGNLVFVGQPGATRGPKGFARFKTDAEGWVALEKDLLKKKLDKKRMQKAWTWLTFR